MRFIALLGLLLPVLAGAKEMRLGPRGCLVVSALTFTPATGDPQKEQGPHLKGTVQNHCDGPMTLTGTAIFNIDKEQVGDAPINQEVGKGLTVTFDVNTVVPESARATAASLSDAHVYEQ